MSVKEKFDDLPNVIFIEKSIHDSKEQMIDEYVDILKSLKSEHEIRALMSIIYDDIVYKTGSWIIERQIQDKIRMLEQIKISK